MSPSWKSLFSYVFWARCICVAALLVCATPAFAECDSNIPNLSTNDCDEDGVTIGEGDCDDEDALVSPDELEECGDNLDNDCNGTVDDACDEFPEGAMLSGGGQCRVGPAQTLGNASALTLLVWMLLIRRREPLF